MIQPNNNLAEATESLNNTIENVTQLLIDLPAEMCLKLAYLNAGAPYGEIDVGFARWLKEQVDDCQIKKQEYLEAGAPYGNHAEGLVQWLEELNEATGDHNIMRNFDKRFEKASRDFDRDFDRDFNRMKIGRLITGILGLISFGIWVVVVLLQFFGVI